ncbi:GNAT family N-acetyltransferase [Brachybacterium sp. AOP43-C2-M15]|uniref:GNAT family N-acetyltransferase n=1 Tax=Brachybacterium sp. AOP43-C2-M15 TaxID=3457661 RepID=UPI0040338DFD
MSGAGEVAERTVVRRLDPEDWRVWRGLRLRALEESPEAFSSTLDEVLARDTEQYWRAGVSAPMVPFVAEVDGAPAGMGRLLLPAPPEERAELLSVWVAPEARGRGAGRLLISTAVDHLAAHHLGTRLLLAVLESNAPARRLYARCGFGVIGRNPDDDAELLMEHGADR